ncbi:uncharacterized protein LOC143076446 [Mytilus galloprovincialis]|uniref:Uncharacterized protein n=1 Tax=Mytilus galloprovincialis TaxID=29158 RepID=A0A8B6DSV8_MYTGA|nr:Hypothetical predicted protein [Mytilus galloprovincialis]
MPKVPNRRHSHHLIVEDEKRAFVEAVIECGLNGEQFAEFIGDSVTSQRRRNRGDRKIRWIFYCNWAHSMKEAEIGPENAHYAWPNEVLKYLRSLVPFDVKGEIKKDAFKVSMVQFCEVVGRKNDIMEI